VMATAMAALVGIPAPATADVTSVSGSATGYHSSVSLFGGPASQRGPAGTPGCDPNQPAPGPRASQTEGCSPTVVLPATGSPPLTVTDADGARAVYGPATVFGSIWPLENSVAPPSGPITVSTQGSTGPGRSVTSSVSITRAPSGSTWLPPGLNAPMSWPGGIGPGPLLADGVSSTCTAAETNPATGATSISGSTTITNGHLALDTDQYGSPFHTVPMPANPSPNDGPHRGVLTNVGDSYEVFYNEQDTSVPGAITVTAIHMRLLGPIAVGDLYIGVSRCGVVTRPAAGPTNNSRVCGTLATAHRQLEAVVAWLRPSASPAQMVAMSAALDRFRDRMRAAGCPSPVT
jgi:hypothetical protein